ncbi:helix-turn-helix domain-containing protein [Pseudonocardia spinosispora]|uniref:helix-turn-helix domain-containing protein n=1 Tax=Pseudonocardia spinosispora TaxID=103441 RepID=UPI0004146EAC|nr:XRE family transcriptional regulator [Pseudonocardia spinosispora]
MIDDYDTVLAAIGPRLRGLRLRGGTTLAAVAVRTGISVSTLSRLESGIRAPTLDLLLPLAREYRVALDELVDADPTGDPRVYPKPMSRHGMTVVPLSPTEGELQAFKCILGAGPVGAEPDQRSHEGYHWLTVLNGRLRVVLGDRDLVLTTGQAAEFDTRVPHWFGNAEPRAVEFLSVLSSTGRGIDQRIHPSDFPGTSGQHAR